MEQNIKSLKLYVTISAIVSLILAITFSMMFFVADIHALPAFVYCSLAMVPNILGLLSILKTNRKLLITNCVLSIVFMTGYVFLFVLEAATNLHAAFLRISGNATTPGTYDDYLFVISIIGLLIVLVIQVVISLFSSKQLFYLQYHHIENQK